MTKSEDVRVVAPALEKYAHEVVLGDLWKRAGLSPRDRSIVTVSALIARDQTVELPYYLNLALDNGVKPAEISEIITHLAIYTGWAKTLKIRAGWAKAAVLDSPPPPPLIRKNVGNWLEFHHARHSESSHGAHIVHAHRNRAHTRGNRGS